MESASEAGSVPRRIQTLFLDGPAGRLEALLEEPDGSEPSGVALVCHPHPLHGGTMHNKVVYRLAKGLRRSGHTVLRFNFRGVNLSAGSHDNGVGEVEDARVGLEYLLDRYASLAFTLAGFSFGSRVALKLAAEHSNCSRVLAAGFPAHYPDLDFVRSISVPRFFIHSTHDLICDPAAAHSFYESLNGPKAFHWVKATDHFFAGSLVELEELVFGLGE